MAVADAAFITRILVPRRQQHVMRRQRLIDLLHEHVHLHLQVVSAPPGYGKTTLLVDFANDLEIPVCWYSLDVSDQDPRLLLEGILAALRFRFPDVGRLTESRLLMAEDVATEFTHLVDTLTGEIYAAIPDYFVLVLEDYHFVQDSDPAKLLLNLFVSHATDNCHIIISSRTSIELSAVAALPLQRRACSIGTLDLAFTAEEVKELLAVQYHLHLSVEQAQKLTTDTEGWIAGILLSTYALDVGGTSTDIPKPSRQDVFRYLASEVYERQPPDIRRFLLASSTLSDMEVAICDQLMGVTNCQKLLQDVERRNLFISRIDGKKTWYRYHHLFREFLQATLLGENPEQFVLLHYKAASLLEQDHGWNEAVTHFLVAKKYEEVLRVIKTVGEDFIKSGKWMTVSKWLEALPTDRRTSDPELVLLHTQSLIHTGEVDKAARLLTELLRQLTGENEWLHRARALSWRSAAFRLTGHFTEAKHDIETAIRVLEQHGGPADILGDAYRRLGNIHAEQGRLRLALKYQRRALKQYCCIFDVGLMALAHNSLGIIHKRLGDLTRASTHFERAREGWQKVQNYGSLSLTLNNIGIIYHLQGQYDFALDTFHSGLEKARETGYRRTEALILINKAEVLRNLGLYDEALTAYREGMELARQVMEPYYVTYATAGTAETYRLLGARDKAEVLLKEAISQAEEQGQTYGAALFATQLGIIEYERGQYDAATALLLRASERLQAIGDKEALAKANFHLAQISFLSKKYDAAEDWLEKVCELAEELGYDEFLAVEGRNSVLLIQYAASRHVGGNRFVRIMEKIRRGDDIKSRLATPATSVAPSVRAKPDIEAHALGETSVLVNSRQISEADWRSNRAKEIFFYMLHCGAGQTKEQVIAALWPDLSPAKGTSNFHINLYRAKRAISPGIFTLEQGQYKLNPDLNIWYDVVVFGDLLSRSESPSLDSEARVANLEQAIRLYKGVFMPEFYSEWTEMHRRHLEDRYLKALTLLAKFYADKSRYGEAIALLEKFITVDPYQDEVYCQIIEWHLVTGDQPSALRTYKRYVDTMTAETAVLLPARMEALRNRIITGKEIT